MRGDPPRHIRDIAHLYLSRMRRPGGVRVVVAGVSADVFPGFHAANLAVAASARGVPAHIEERSGLPVDTGCFLGLDPGFRRARRDGENARLTAFARVTFTLASDPGTVANPRSLRETDEALEFVHVPPWDAGAEHGRALADVLSRAGPAVVLYLAESDAGARPWRETGDRPGAVVKVAYVTNAGRGADEGECAGVFTRWTRVLTDPVPVVLRDPGSRLARQYTEAASALLAAAPPVVAINLRNRIDPGHAVAALEPR